LPPQGDVAIACEKDDRDFYEVATAAHVREKIQAVAGSALEVQYQTVGPHVRQVVEDVRRRRGRVYAETPLFERKSKHTLEFRFVIDDEDAAAGCVFE